MDCKVNRTWSIHNLPPGLTGPTARPAASAVAGPSVRPFLCAAPQSATHSYTAPCHRNGPTPPTATGAPMSEFPVVLNHRVKRALKYPQTHRSAVIAQAFWRARRYAGMMRAISQQKTRDFWQLRLPTETKRFVPKFMAMTIISRDPGRYGFSPPSEAPHDIEFLHVSQPTEIRHIADAAGTTVTHLRELNQSWLASPRRPMNPAMRSASPGASSRFPTRSKRGRRLS